MSRVNVPLLRKAVEWAEAEAMKPPELCEWEQRFWHIPRGEGHWAEDAYLENRAAECGTTYCIAGYVCEATAVDVSPEAAAAALGVDWDFFNDQAAANRLFKASNSIEDVRRIAEDLAGERL